MDRPLKIAHCVESYWPALGGMPEVVKQLSERMVKAGHKVTVLTSQHSDRRSAEHNGVLITSFPLSGNMIAGITGDHEPYVNALLNGKFDVVTFFAAQQWATDAALDHLQEIPARTVFVPTGFSALYDPKWSNYYSNMPKWLELMDLNVFLSHQYQDIALARKNGLDNIMVIPNGAAAEEFEAPSKHDIRKEFNIPKSVPMVLHIGSYTGIKGHKEAIRIFLKARTGDAVLVLVGNGNSVLKQHFENHYSYWLMRLRAKAKGKQILFLELDRTHTVSALQQANIFLFPSNVECSPIVLFEANAAGVPFISSGAGNAEEIARWTSGGMTIPGQRDPAQLERPDIGEGATLLTDLLKDTPKREAMGAAGKAAWKERFTWKHITEQYIEAYQDLVKSNA